MNTSPVISHDYALKQWEAFVPAVQTLADAKQLAAPAPTQTFLSTHPLLSPSYFSFLHPLQILITHLS